MYFIVYQNVQKNNNINLNSCLTLSLYHCIINFLILYYIYTAILIVIINTTTYTHYTTLYITFTIHIYKQIQL